MFVYSYQPKNNLTRNIACDTCCDVTHNKRNVLKIFKFYLKSNINQGRFNVDRSNLNNIYE